MKKHNIKFMNIRMIPGSVFNLSKEFNSKKQNISIKDELLNLLQYSNKFNLILCTSKSYDTTKIYKNLNNYCNIVIKNNLQNFVIGYDLVGSEDNNPDLTKVIDNLLLLQKKYDIKYYIHAGEFIHSKNSLENLKLINKLNISRIGHGSYYLIPNNDNELELNSNNIIEICPIGNYLFHNTIYDFEKLKKYINTNNIVIGSDDDNKQNSNLTFDYMFLFLYYRLSIDEIKKLLLNSFDSINENIYNNKYQINDFNNKYQINNFNDEYNKWYNKYKNILNNYY